MHRSARTKKSASSHPPRVGIGGWTYAPWHDTFYPEGCTRAQALAWASRQLPTIEINGTYYRTQSAASFARWHDETPDDFVFAVKAPRAIVQRKVLAETQSSIDRFMDSGLDRLGRKLGPILWQFMPGKAFDRADLDAFFSMLPEKCGRLRLRHAVEVRHASFDTPDFLALAQCHNVAVVVSDRQDAPHLTALTADFRYVRLQAAQERYRAGYAPAALSRWATQLAEWSTDTDVFAYAINGFKPKAPALALSLMQRLASKI